MKNTPVCMTLHDNFVLDLSNASDIPVFMHSVGEVCCKCCSFVSFYYSSSGLYEFFFKLISPPPPNFTESLKIMYTSYMRNFTVKPTCSLTFV